MFLRLFFFFVFFFFNDTATTEIYTLSLHDALPIRYRSRRFAGAGWPPAATLIATCTPNTRHSLRLPSGRLWSPSLPRLRVRLRPSPTAVPRIGSAGRGVPFFCASLAPVAP